MLNFVTVTVIMDGQIFTHNCSRGNVGKYFTIDFRWGLYALTIFTKRLTTMANGALGASRRRAGRELLNEKIGSGISSKKANVV